MGTVGEKLRQAREREGLSIRDASDRTKIRSDHIEALEAGNYEVFSAPVYIRGFVRSYASHLKLNVEEMVAMLDRELSQTERFAEHPKLTGESKGILDFVMLQLSKINWTVAFPLILLAVILLVSVIGYRIYRKSQSENPLKDLGPGLYQPKPAGDKLPLPTK
ncbi:MAG: helix-turn-helix domain-containing protein [Verrucomicrobiota bacterium]|jgi:cytoskeletal protein RodZ